MALFSMKLENLQQLFVKELRDLYDAENQITDALPKLIDAAQHSDLKNALQQHLNVTQQQIAPPGPYLPDAEREAHGRNLQRHEGSHQRRRRDRVARAAIRAR